MEEKKTDPDFVEDVASVAVDDFDGPCDIETVTVDVAVGPSLKL